MNQFYLNNIVGAPASVADGKNALCNVAKAFGRLSAQEELNVDRRIVMDKEPLWNLPTAPAMRGEHSVSP